MWANQVTEECVYYLIVLYSDEIQFKGIEILPRGNTSFRDHIFTNSYTC